MASSVFYKFKSQKDESRVTFDGTGISVFDLKKEIILANNLGKANDFDLFVFDSSSQQEYKDDSQIIPRSSSVIVKRLPASRPGKGKAALYIGTSGAASQTAEQKHGGPSGAIWHKGAMSKRFDGKDDSSSKLSTVTPAVKSSIAKDDEAAAMAAMFQATTANWEETQERMSHAVKIYNNPRGTSFPRGGGRPQSFAGRQEYNHQPERPLPPSYVCYRCGQKGHWIQDCPTNSDREYDNRPRIKRTTGIPRSMLKPVENPTGGQLGQGVMVTPEGGYVVAQPDLRVQFDRVLRWTKLIFLTSHASWQKQVSRNKGLTAADVRERPPTDPSLACPLDGKLFREAVKTPCCNTTYSEENIQTHLLERDFVCPGCGKKIASLDELVPDQLMRRRVNDYIEKVVEDSKKAAEDENAGNDQSSTAQDSTYDQDIYSDQQPGGNLDMSQMLVDSIPQLQAQISQISLMLQNPALPNQVRRTTEMQHQQLQIQLQQAQTIATALAAASSFQQQQVQQQQQQQQQLQQLQQQTARFAKNEWQQQQWGNQYTTQQGQDSAYQRLPVNNRRRNQKRERPSDFLEVGGDGGDKVPRYWE